MMPFERRLGAFLEEVEEELRKEGVPEGFLTYMRGSLETRHRLSPIRIARELIQVEPMPQGATSVYYLEPRPLIPSDPEVHMGYQGLDSVPHILTEADVLKHCYGKSDAESEAPASSPASIPAPAPVSVPAPSVAPEAPVDDDAKTDPPPPAPSVEEVAAKLEHDHNKSELVTFAEQADLDASGTKSDIALRLAKHYSST